MEKRTREFNKRTKEFLANRKRRMRLRAVIGTLSVVVAFIVVYNLMTPAITISVDDYNDQSNVSPLWSPVTFCGLEAHTHDDSCVAVELTCGEEARDAVYIEAHAHDENCYDEEGNLICGQEAREEYHDPGHTHTSACYTERMICEKTEHQHTDACYSDPQADVENATLWERSLPEALSGDWAADVVAVAQSQVGYTESVKNYRVEEDGSRKGWNRYAAFAGRDPHDAWNTDFISFVMYYSGVPTTELPYGGDLNQLINALAERGNYYAAEFYGPKPGDLIFLSEREGEGPAYVGVVTATDEDDKLALIAGDMEDSVQHLTIALDDPRIFAYAALPESPYGPQPVPEQIEVSSGDETAEPELVEDAEEQTEVVFDDEANMPEDTDASDEITEPESSETPHEAADMEAHSASEVDASEYNITALPDMDFSSRRLLVVTRDESVLTRGHILGQYGDTWLLLFASEEETAVAYLYYQEHAEMVEPDIELIVAAEENEPHEENEEYVESTENAESTENEYYEEITVVDEMPADEDGTMPEENPLEFLAELAEEENAAANDELPADVDGMTPEENPLERLVELLEEEGAAYMANAAPAWDFRPVIALIDTGVSDESVEAYSVIGDSTADDNGHGSNMLAYIREENPGARVISIKALDGNGRGDMSAVYAAVQLAMEKGADIISLSITAYSTEGNAVLGEAVKDALRRGIVVVAAAGNRSTNAAYFTPANIEGVTTIGAADEVGYLNGTSNYGDVVNYYVTAGSTSEAAARFTGVISLAKSLPEYYDAIAGYLEGGYKIFRDANGMPQGQEEDDYPDGDNIDDTFSSAATKINVKVNKVWKDADGNTITYPTDHLGNPINSVTVHLLANGQRLNPDKTAILSKANGWTYTFSQVDHYINNAIVNYTVEEESPDDWSYTTEKLAPQMGTGTVTYTTSNGGGVRIGGTSGATSGDGLATMPVSSASFLNGMPEASIKINVNRINTNDSSLVYGTDWTFETNQPNLWKLGSARNTYGVVYKASTSGNNIAVTSGKTFKTIAGYYKLTFKNAATMPDGSLADVVITYTNTRFRNQNGMQYRIAKTDAQRTARKGAHAITINKDVLVSTGLWLFNYRDDPVNGEGNSTLSTAVDVNVKIVLPDGTPVGSNETFIFSTTDLDQPDQSNNINGTVSGNDPGINTSAGTWTNRTVAEHMGYYGTTTQTGGSYGDFREGMWNVRGTLGPAYIPAIMTDKTTYASNQNAPKDGRKIYIYGSNASNANGLNFVAKRNDNNTSYDSGFAVLANASSGISFTWTGQGNGMGTRMFIETPRDYEQDVLLTNMPSKLLTIKKTVADPNPLPEKVFTFELVFKTKDYKGDETHYLIPNDILAQINDANPNKATFNRLTYEAGRYKYTLRLKQNEEITLELPNNVTYTMEEIVESYDYFFKSEIEKHEYGGINDDNMSWAYAQYEETLTAKNTAKLLPIAIQKLSIVPEGVAGSPEGLSDAVFVLYADEDFDTTTHTPKAGATPIAVNYRAPSATNAVGNLEGMYVSANVYVGKYWLVEQTAPEGYHKLTKPVPIYATESPVAYGKTAPNPLYWNVKLGDDAASVLGIEDELVSEQRAPADSEGDILEYIRVENVPDGTVTIYKRDENGNLITNYDETAQTEALSATFYISGTSMYDEEISMTGSTVRGTVTFSVPVGTYTVTELAPPEGYELAAGHSHQTVTVTRPGQVIAIDVVNREESDRIVKYIKPSGTATQLGDWSRAGVYVTNHSQFDYKLVVRNPELTAMKDLVVLDKLPTVGDADSLGGTAARGSDFNVRLEGNESIRVYVDGVDRAGDFEILYTNDANVHTMSMEDALADCEWRADVSDPTAFCVRAKTGVELAAFSELNIIVHANDNNGDWGGNYQDGVDFFAYNDFAIQYFRGNSEDRQAELSNLVYVTKNHGKVFIQKVGFIDATYQSRPLGDGGFFKIYKDENFDEATLQPILNQYGVEEFFTFDYVPSTADIHGVSDNDGGIEGMYLTRTAPLPEPGRYWLVEEYAPEGYEPFPLPIPLIVSETLSSYYGKRYYNVDLDQETFSAIFERLAGSVNPDLFYDVEIRHVEDDAEDSNVLNYLLLYDTPKLKDLLVQKVSTRMTAGTIGDSHTISAHIEGPSVQSVRPMAAAENVARAGLLGADNEQTGDASSTTVGTPAPAEHIITLLPPTGSISHGQRIRYAITARDESGAVVNLNGKYGGVTFENGVATAQMSAHALQTAIRIPVSTGVTSVDYALVDFNDGSGACRIYVDGAAQSTTEGTIRLATTQGDVPYVLEGVSLKLTPVDPTGTPITGTTDANGQYRFENLWPGTYLLTEESTADGHYKFEPKTVVIQPDGQIIVDGADLTDGILTAEDPVAEIILKKTRADETFEATYGDVLQFATSLRSSGIEAELGMGTIAPSMKYHQLVFNRYEGCDYTLTIATNDTRLNGRINGVNFTNGVATVPFPRTATGNGGNEVIVRLPLSVTSADVGITVPGNLNDSIVLFWPDGQSVDVAGGQSASRAMGFDSAMASGQAALEGATLQLLPIDPATFEEIAGGEPISATSDENGKLTFQNVPPGTYRLEETDAPLGYSEISQMTVAVDEYGNVTIDGMPYTEGYEVEDPVQYGGFDIVKNVEGGNADPENDTFKFTIRVYDSEAAYNNGVGTPSRRINTDLDEGITHGTWGDDENGDVRLIMFENGVATIYLKNGERAEIRNLKEGMYYVVTEDLTYNRLNTRYVPQPEQSGQVNTSTMVPVASTNSALRPGGISVKAVNPGQFVEKFDEVKFNNLAPKESLDLEFDKQVNSGPVDEVYDGQFSFALYKAEDWFTTLMEPKVNTTPFLTAVNAHEDSSDNYNKVSFPSIEYTYADIADEPDTTKVFTYYVKETGVGASGLIMDATVYKIVDTVSYNADDGFTVTRVMTKFVLNDDDTWTESTVTSGGGEIELENPTAPIPTFNNTGKGTLVISKSLIGNAAEADREFEIYLRLKTANGAAVTQEQLTGLGVKATRGGNETALTLADTAATYRDANGTEQTLAAGAYAVLPLKGGESITISDLRPGWTYEVFEKDYAADGYQTTIADGTGAIETSVSKAAAVYNARNGISIHKTDLDGTLTLENAEFKLVRVDEMDEIKLGPDDTDYVITLTDGTGSFILPPETEDLLNQAGVSSVVFRLYETVAPDKYALPVNPWTIIVTKKTPAATETYVPGQWDIVLMTQGGAVIDINRAPEGGDATYDGYYDIPNIPLSPVELVKIADHRYEDWLENEDGSYSDVLNGATFTLYSAYDAEHPDDPAKTVVAQNYEGTELKDMTVDATTGRISLGLLTQGTYYLVETVPPPGYYRISQPIQVSVAADQVSYSISSFKGGQPLPAVGVIRDPDAENPETVQILGIPNRALDLELPHTGGMGTKFFYALGAFLILATGSLLVVRRRNRQQ